MSVNVNGSGEAWASGLRAVNAMSVTPFDERGRLDEDALARVVDGLAVEEVGIYLGSYGTGEGHLLRPREIRRIYEVGVAAAAGRVPVYAAALGFAATERVIEQALEAAEAGVDAVQIHPPRPAAVPVMPRLAELERYYADVLAEVRGPIHLSDQVVMTGYRLPGDLLGDLVTAFPAVEAVNVSDPDLGQVSLLVAALRSRVAVRVGIVAELPTALLLGGQGMLCFEADVAPQLCREVVDAFRSGAVDRWSSTFQRLMLLNAALSRAREPAVGQGGDEAARHARRRAAPSVPPARQGAGAGDRRVARFARPALAVVHRRIRCLCEAVLAVGERGPGDDEEHHQLPASHGRHGRLRARPDGEIGNRDGLKHHCPQGLAGSSPAPGTAATRFAPIDCASVVECRGDSRRSSTTGAQRFR